MSPCATYWLTAAGAVFIAGSNLASLYFEYLLLSKVHKSVIAVAEQNGQHISAEGEQDGVMEESEESSQGFVSRVLQNAAAPFRDLRDGGREYLKQKIMPAGLSLAILFVSVLQFGSIMTVVLNWAGVPPYVIAVFRGLGALFGIMATLTFSG